MQSLDIDPSDPLVSVDYAGWWARGTALAKRSWLQLLVLQSASVGFSLLVILPLNLLRSWIFGRGGMWDISALMRASLIETPVIYVLLVLQLTAYAVVGLAAVHLVTAVAAGQPASAGAAARRAMARFGPTLGWSLVFSLLVEVGLAACVVPGLYLALLWMMLAPVLAYERGNPFDRTFTLANRGLNTSIGVMATMLGGYGAALVVQILVGRLLPLVLIPALGAASQYVTLVLTAVVGCLVFTGVGLLAYPLQTDAYAHLRARQEPLSTAQLAAELAA